MLLFDSFVRTFDKPKTELESSFCFLNRSSSPAFGKVRVELESWFANYPESNQRQLALRFQKEFESAFYELFLHEFLLRIGATIEIERTLGTKNKYPDFVAEFGENRLVLEATVFADESNAAQKSSKRLAQLYDSINEIDAPFWLSVQDVVQHTDKQVSSNQVKAFLIRELALIAPDSLGETIKNYR